MNLISELILAGACVSAVVSLYLTNKRMTCLFEEYLRMATAERRQLIERIQAGGLREYAQLTGQAPFESFEPPPVEDEVEELRKWQERFAPKQPTTGNDQTL